MELSPPQLIKPSGNIVFPPCLSFLYLQESSPYKLITRADQNHQPQVWVRTTEPLKALLLLSLMRVKQNNPLESEETPTREKSLPGLLTPSSRCRQSDHIVNALYPLQSGSWRRDRLAAPRSHLRCRAHPASRWGCFSLCLAAPCRQPPLSAAHGKCWVKSCR